MAVSAMLLIFSLLRFQGDPEPVQSFSALFEAAAAGDREAEIERLFRSRPYEVVLLIDDYLQAFAGSDGPARDRLALAARAARVADRVFEQQVFARQVEALGRQDAEQRVRLLLGRQAFRGGRLAQREQRYEQAGEAFSEALSTANELGDLLGSARAEQALADLAVGARRMDEALRRHRQARDQLGRLHHPAELRSCRALAMLHERRGEFKQARGNLERMLEAAHEAGRETDTSQVREALVRICRSMGDREAARKYARPE